MKRKFVVAVGVLLALMTIDAIRRTVLVAESPAYPGAS